jgi:hypothetical protein
MADTPETSSEPLNRLGREFEDPHYHDEDESVSSDDSQPRVVRMPPGHKPARRIPPPKRRFYED